MQMVRDRNTGEPRGFAFVRMSSWEDADEAIVRLNGTSLSGRQLVVSEAQSMPNVVERKNFLDARWSQF